MGHRAFFVGRTRHLGVEEGIGAFLGCVGRGVSGCF